MTLSENIRKLLLRVTTLGCGILVLVLLRWTPTTGRGIFIYAIVLAVLLAIAVFLSPRNRTGYWPKKPGDR